MRKIHRKRPTGLLLLIFLLFFLPACQSTMSVEEARSLALEFHGEKPPLPTRGFGPEIQEIVARYRNGTPEYECPATDPRANQQLIKYMGRGRDGHFQLQEIARKDYFLGNIESAIVLAEAAAKKADKASPRAGCQFDQAMFLAESGDFIGAKKVLRKASASLNAMLREHKKRNYTWEHRWELKFGYLSALSHASIRFAEGDMKQAEAYYYRALDLLTEIRQLANLTYSGQGHLLAHVKIGIARSLMWQDRLMEAEAWARESLVDHWGFMLPRVFITLSRIYYAQGRFELSRVIAQTTVNMYTGNRLEKFGCNPVDSLPRALARETLAQADLALGNVGSALEQYNLIKKEMTSDPGTYKRLFEGNLDLGVALLMADRLKEARTQFAKAHEKALDQLGEDHYTTYRAEALHALTLSAAGDAPAARKILDRFIQNFLSPDKQVSGSSVGAFTRQNQVALIVEGYIELLAQTGDQQSVNRAFEIAGLYQSRAVGKALADSSARSAAGDTELIEIIRQRQDLEMNLTANHGRMVSMMRAPESTRQKQIIEKLRSESDLLKAALTALDQEIASKFPEYERMTSPGTMSVDDIRPVMKKSEAFLSVFSGQKATYAWAFGKHGDLAFARIPIGADELGQDIARLREALIPGGIHTVNDLAVFDTDLAHQLFRNLMAPVRQGWEDANLLVVAANTPLNRLPLSVLVTEPVAPVKHNRGPWFSEYRQVPWLARTHAIAQLPSAGSLVNLRKRPHSVRTNITFAGFGDPRFAPAAPQNPSKDSKTTVVQRGLHLRATPVPRGLDVASVPLSGLPRLPETADEVREIALAVGADPQADIFCGLRASESRVKQMDLSDRRIIVFATHGLMPGDLDSLHEPALALSHPSLFENEDDDGLLTMGEIMWLKLNSDWVVLSACNTAAAGGQGKEALSGLGQAFFYAGAKSLLVTSWPVETNSAKTLTTGIFHRLAQDPDIHRAEALRLSCLALMDGPGPGEYTYAHPLFWAPFIIVGDGGS